MAAYFSVSSIAGAGPVGWSTGVFVYMTAALTIGPRGALCVGISDALGFVCRFRVGVLRTVFNAATHLIEATSALIVFELLKSNLVLAGTFAGVADLVTNSGLLMGAIVMGAGAGRRHSSDSG